MTLFERLAVTWSFDYICISLDYHSFAMTYLYLSLQCSRMFTSMTNVYNSFQYQQLITVS